jgi:hypothetical protein
MENGQKRASWTTWRAGSLLLIVALGVLLSSVSQATAQQICIVCKQTKGGQFYVSKNKYYKKDIHYCKACYDLSERCDVCQFPVLPKTGLRLPDKRVICAEHSSIVVMNENAAETLFVKARDEVMDIVRQYPPLPQLNIKFHLVTREDFVQEYRRTPGIDDPYSVQGLTISREREGEGKLQHDIYVVHGLTDETFLAVCAHEYTHAWLNERQKPTRLLHHDTREGVCELMAHKVATKLGYQREVTQILENAYTRGQIEVLLAAEKEYGLYKFIRWIDQGVDSWIDKDKLSQLLVVGAGAKDEEPSPVALNWVNAKPIPAPQKLSLKGLSGTGNRRFALINDATLGANEQGKVRLGNSNVVVRCLSISSNSVTVEIKGEATPRTLILGL